MLWGENIVWCRGGRFRGFDVLDGVLISVAYVVGVYSGSLLCLMCACHKGCSSF